MIIDTILRNTILADKMIDFFIKDEKITEINAIQKLEELTPLAKIVLDAKPKPKPIEEDAGGADAGADIPILDGPKPGPIDVEYKAKMKATAPFNAKGYVIKTWGRRGADNKQLGVWGEFVSVDYDICIADGACIEACPVGVYEWFDTPGNVASEKKPLMSKEPDCIFCLACEGVCPPSAIKIFEQK
jgi:NAD-dependent dihydropyrimidine dehydrogenase PreA subunit